MLKKFSELGTGDIIWVYVEGNIYCGSIVSQEKTNCGDFPIRWVFNKDFRYHYWLIDIKQLQEFKKLKKPAIYQLDESCIFATSFTHLIRYLIDKRKSIFRILDIPFKKENKKIIEKEVRKKKEIEHDYNLDINYMRYEWYCDDDASL